MINLRHIKFLVIIIFSLLLSSQSFADKKFEKDLKKISIDNGFIDNFGNVYLDDKITDKSKTILIIVLIVLFAWFLVRFCLVDHNMSSCLKNG